MLININHIIFNRLYEKAHTDRSLSLAKIKLFITNGKKVPGKEDYKDEAAAKNAAAFFYYIQTMFFQLLILAFIPSISSIPYANPFLTRLTGRNSSYFSKSGTSLG